MKLFIISIALVAIASCKSAETARNGNAIARSTSGATANAPRITPHDPCLNLNIATSEELNGLPGIGEVMAKKIIDYREGHGRFRRSEEIIIIEGFSERKYRAIAGLICVE